MRTLRPAEMAGLLAGDIVAHLATVDAAGYPHVTPVWFLWDHEAFRLTSRSGRTHLNRIRANPRVGLVIDRDAGHDIAGTRSNRQVRIIGDAQLAVDADGMWTRRIGEKYLGGAMSMLGEHDKDRILITITPSRLLAVAC